MSVSRMLRIAGVAVIAAFVLPAAGAEIGEAAPGFTLHNSKGAPVTLSQYKGKVVLLDFWATWCTGCKVELPWYVEFDKKYKRKGLAVLGVSMDDGGDAAGWKLVKPFLKEKGIR
jgi:peroxiredoxin